MKHVILSGLSALALSTIVVSPVMAETQSVTPSTRTGLQLIQNSNSQADSIELERQQAIEEINQMFDRERQSLMENLDQHLSTMHQEMVRMVNERFAAAHQAVLDK